MQFRADISIRVRGQTPFDFKELKSENYDDIDDFATAVGNMVKDNCLDYLDAEEEDDSSN